jgi:hypothetical protein
MKRLLFTILLISVQLAIYSQDNVGKVVPSEWISMALKNENTLDLIRRFESSFPPFESNFPVSDQPYLSLTEINLDEDDGSEFVLFLGTDYSRTMFYIIDHDFKIIFQEYLWLHNDYPQLVIYNSSDQHKILSYKYLYSRGSGQWLFSRKFFKVYEGKAFLVLEIVDDSNDTFNDKGINGRIRLENIEEYNGQLHVSYSYDLYPHENVLQKLGLGSQDYSLIKIDKENFIYEFQDDTKKFSLFGIYKDSTKETYFFNPSNDSMFIKAFSSELKQIESKGSIIDKKIIQYLKNKNN